MKNRFCIVTAATVISALIFLPKAQANTLFEGWFEVYKGAEKIGFLVEKYEFTDSKFKAVYYLKTDADGNNVTESVKAFAKNDLSPLSYAYTTKVGDTIKVIDATFKGENEKLEIFDGKHKSKETKKIKKGTFLSQFLPYLILLQPDGMKAGKDYDYYAIAEEDGVTYKGNAFIKDEEEVKGRKAFKILNQFKGEKFFSWVTAKGEPLLTRDPDNNVEVRFADGREDATKGIMVNLQDIKLLFGGVPGSLSTGVVMDGKGKVDSGTDDLIKAGAKIRAPPAGAGGGTSPGTAVPLPSKKTSHDPGNGIEIKGVPPPSSSTSGPSNNTVPTTSGTGDSSGK